MRRLLTALLTSACFALFATPASAIPLQLNSFTYSSADTVSVHLTGGLTPNVSYTGAAGEFTGTANGQDLKTFCLDLYQEFYFGQTYTYTLMALPTRIAHDLALLVTSYRSAVTNADSSAAFQLAAWEIMYETPGTAYSLNTGAFIENGSSSAVERNLANTWLSNLGTNTNVTVSLLQNPDHQDFLMTTPIPEPSSYVMLATALGLMGLVIRRKKQA